MKSLYYKFKNGWFNESFPSLNASFSRNLSKVLDLHFHRGSIIGKHASWNSGYWISFFRFSDYSLFLSLLFAIVSLVGMILLNCRVFSVFYPFSIYLSSEI